jgi:hypothetical protein
LDREAVEELGALREEMRALKAPFGQELSPMQARVRLLARRYPRDPRALLSVLEAKRYGPGRPKDPARLALELRVRRARWNA